MIDTILSTLDTAALWGIGLCLAGVLVCLMFAVALILTITID